MDDWLVEYWPALPHEDLPDAYVVHVSPDVAVRVLRGRPSGNLWCLECSVTGREGCAHIRAARAWQHNGCRPAA